MIDFTLSPETTNTQKMIHAVADSTMRPTSREYDEREHEKPTEWLTMMWNGSKNMISFGESGKKATKSERKPSERTLRAVVLIEELSWGDAGLYLSIPNSGLGGDHDYGGAGWRSLGVKWHKNLLHQRAYGRRKVGRIRRGLGDGRQISGACGDQSVCCRSSHSGDDRSEGGKQNGHPRL